MVSRKPVPSAGSNVQQQDNQYLKTRVPSGLANDLSQTATIPTQRLPHPIDDEDTSNPWQDVQRPDISEDWEDTVRGQRNEELPQSLRVQTTSSSGGTSSDLPNQIRTGLRQLTPQSSWEKDSDSEDELRKPATNAPNYAPPAPPTTAPPSLPSTSNNPFRTKVSEGIPQIPVARDENDSNIWAEIRRDQSKDEAAPVPVADMERLELEESPGWETIQPAPIAAPATADSPLIDLDNAEDYKRELEATPFGPAEGLEDFNQPAMKGKGVQSNETSGYQPPSGPPPTYSAPSKHSDRKITVSEETANRQRNETYQIKHVRWADANSHEIRTSPILIQNKNGPCPLMALVNALTLSTPPDSNTALVETLRVREQISLGLLLDAVFDELMSGRRGDAAQGLPDVSELYAFLITLHTGMNVNPRFMPINPQQNLMDGPGELPPEIYRKPGTFEDTKEMMLYGTFSIPLIHGWLPSKNHAAFQALQRSAVTYEDAQNLMFREEELEDKVRHSGLSPQEQQLLEDISSIKYFLSSTATQLTGHGLDTINEALQPGAIAILFRNDHFSTLYKQPHSGQLLSLVTDAGYSTHDEIVWESLVDVGGQGSEFFSGDFRLVGGNPAQSPNAFEHNASPSGEWTTVQRGKGQRGAPETNKPLPNDFDQPSGSGRDHEQEDADLALALQLQEEEEENSRRTAAERNRQSNTTGLQSSNNANSPGSRDRIHGRHSRQPSQNIQPLLPPRRNTAQANPRPPVHRTNNDDDAPPSYEQASNTEPYNENNPSQIPLTQTTSRMSGSSRPVGRPRGQSAYSENTQYSNPSSPVYPRRRSGVPMMHDPPVGVTTRRASANEKDKDCIIM